MTTSSEKSTKDSAWPKDQWNERNRQVIDEFRAHGGKVTGWAPLILLTTKGAKSGKERINPLMQVPYGNGVVAIASKGGAEKHPEWYLNILAHPEVRVETGHDTYTARARILTGAERAKAYAKAAEVFPPYAEYQQKTPREIPVILLEKPGK